MVLCFFLFSLLDDHQTIDKHTNTPHTTIIPFSFTWCNIYITPEYEEANETRSQYAWMHCKFNAEGGEIKRRRRKEDRAYELRTNIHATQIRHSFCNLCHISRTNWEIANLPCENRSNSFSVLTVYNTRLPCRTKKKMNEKQTVGTHRHRIFEQKNKHKCKRENKLRRIATTTATNKRKGLI